MAASVKMVYLQNQAIDIANLQNQAIDIAQLHNCTSLQLGAHVLIINQVAWCSQRSIRTQTHVSSITRA